MLMRPIAAFVKIAIERVVLTEYLSGKKPAAVALIRLRVLKP
jgi:hypothetical protein